MRDLLVPGAGRAPSGATVLVSEMPSWAWSYGSLATDRARRDHAVGVAAVHRVGAGRERLAGAAAVRGVAGVLAVDHVGGDRQHRLGVHGVAVGRVLRGSCP